MSNSPAITQKSHGASCCDTPSINQIPKSIFHRAYLMGGIAAIGLLVFYFVLVSITSGSVDHTIAQFQKLGVLIVAIAIGFGIQMGLFVFLRRALAHQSTHGSGAVAAGSTGTSAVSMVACCAHHLSEFLPLIGLTGAAGFFDKYVVPIMIFSLIVNILGIIYIANTLRKHNLFFPKWFPAK